MSVTKMIVGLGNPGDEYARTRHNIGFWIIDLLAKFLEVDVGKRKFGARYGRCDFKGVNVILLKPWQYMNRSGEAAAKAVDYYKLDLDRLLVVLDDMWLEPGRIRIRAKGSAGGHNGLADVIEKLGTEDLARLRVGIGQSGRQESMDYVLDRPSRRQKPLIEQAVELAKEAALFWIENGTEKTMNRFNRL